MVSGNYLITLLLVLAPVQSIQVRVNCLSTSPSECASKYKFRVTANNLNLSYCVGPNQKCDLNYDVTFSLYHCDVDFKNSQCTTSVCYNLIPNSQFCTSDFACSGSNVFRHIFTCSSCTSIWIKDCENCFSSSKNGVEDIYEQCVGNSCSGLGGQIDVQWCPKNIDSSGIRCSCCASTKTALRACTSNSPALSLGQLTSYVKKFSIDVGQNTTDNTDARTPDKDDSNTTTANQTNESNKNSTNPDAKFNQTVENNQAKNSTAITNSTNTTTNPSVSPTDASQSKHITVSQTLGYKFMISAVAFWALTLF